MLGKFKKFGKRFGRRLLNYNCYENWDIIESSENNVILFGSVGHGKTTILNKVCGVSYKTADSGFSCTKDIQSGFSISGNMIVIDFPGLRSTKDTLDHLIKQKCILKLIPVKMICFVIKYDKRYDHLIDNLSQMLSIFYEYKNNIAVIITHSEDCSYTNKEDIKTIFTNQFGVNNVIFTTKKETRPLFLCNEFSNLKSKMENIPRLNLKTRDFLATVKNIFDFSVMDERKKYEDEFDDTLKKFEDELKKANNDDLKRAIYFTFKDYKEDLIVRYSNTVSSKKADIDSIITEVIIFNNIIYDKYNTFRLKVQSQIKLQTNNYNNEFNRYKQCPHCGQIWFKIKGCDSMTCGTRTTLKDKISGRYKHYLVQYISNKILITYDEKENREYGNDKEFIGLTDEEKAKNITLEREGKTKISPVGCGKNFKWNDPMVNDCTDEIIRKLNEISVTDYDSGVLKVAEDLGEEEL